MRKILHWFSGNIATPPVNGKALSSFFDCLDLGLTCLPNTQCLLPILKNMLRPFEI